jgi:conjugative transfer region protein TrbK
MDPRIIVRAAAVVLLMGAVLACALEWTQRDRTLKPSTTTAHDNMDPLDDELSRCTALGAEAANDAACKIAWSQNRARFLARSAPHPDRSIE